MGAASLISGSLFNLESVANQQPQVFQEFQQLGQDLQSGNLSAAQSDFATLQQSVSPSGTGSATQSTNPITQAFGQLGQDLQSGDLTAAQQDYSNLTQDLQNQSGQIHHHHHHHGGGGQNNTLEQDFDQLGQDLQSGNLSAAQQAYGSLQQGLQQLGLADATLSTQTNPLPTANLSVSV
ncbi:MAG TPA: hypothetical protein VMU61_02060 [Candidatus Aquilonibacter sp.]|nr:hypothetical protein [Candidatus Aquilonibacter sp.]